VLAVTGCGNSTNVNVAGPSITRCGVSISGSSSPAPAAGGTGTLTVSTARECAWSARSEASWISLSNTQGQGPASLGYSILPNPDGTLRRGSVAVEDQHVEIAQEPAPCRYDVSPLSVDLGASSGAIELNLVAPGGCGWTARPSDAWLSPEPSSGAGATTVRLVVASNPGAARIGNVSIGGATVAVRQAGTSTAPPTPAPPAPAPPAPAPPAPAPPTPTPPTPPPSPPPSCTYSLAPVSRTVDASAADVTVEVRAANGCAWSASSRVEWITVRSGDTGTGNGLVKLAVATNTSQSARTGTVVIAGATFTIEQAGAQACSYTINPTDYNARAGSDDVRVQVKVHPSCSWTSSSPVPWATITEGAAGSGNANVRIRIDANPGAGRSAILIIAGERFTLTQEASRK
jgi:Viral BACON domain/Putative binding domain, N-terminal